MTDEIMNTSPWSLQELKQKCTTAYIQFISVLLREETNFCFVCVKEFEAMDEIIKKRIRVSWLVQKLNEKRTTTYSGFIFVLVLKETSSVLLG